MRILVTADFIFPDHAGGAGRMAWEAAKGLRALGHEVRIWCLSDRSRPERERIEGLDVYRVRNPKFSSNPVEWMGFPRAARRSLGALAKEYAPDRILSHSPLTGWLAQRHPALREVPFIHFFHSSWGDEYRVDRGHRPRAALGGWVRDRLEARVVFRADACAVLSAFMGDQLVRRHGTPRESIRRVPAGIDYDIFCPGDRAQARRRLGLGGEPLLLTVRNLRPRMGLELFLEAAVIVRRAYPKLQAVVAGSGPLEQTVRRAAVDRGLSDAVRFVGRVPDAELPAYYQAADVFVLPSRELEGLGLVLIESLACGTPCAGTPVGGIPEVLNPVDPGWVASEVSGAGLAGAISRALRQPPKPAVLRDAMRSRYGWDLCARALDEMLRGARHG